MNVRAAFSSLKAVLKKDQEMYRYFIQGQGEVYLSRTDFKAQGGEGSIYVKGATAYKIYTNPQRVLSRTKLAELAVLTEPHIVRPLDLLLDRKNRPVGYSMRHVRNAYSLCQLFPKAFRLRNNLTPDVTLRLVRKLQEGIRHVHAKGILIVDLNEMNMLVSEDFQEMFFIDVDSYQTPSFPATVLMESVRDRHAHVFTVNSDWFSFAIVSFQMFVGIHPFKGTYAPLQNLPDKEKKLDARMRANVSVLRADVFVPASCLPFSVIPPVYLDWYRAVFEEGRRMPPPESNWIELALVAPNVQRRSGSNHFEITELQEFDSEIISHDNGLTITQQSVYFEGRKYLKPPFDVKAAITPRTKQLVAAFIDGAKLRFGNLTTGLEIATAIEGEEIMLSNGQLYIKQQENIFEIEFIELPQKLLLSIKARANVALNSTQLFEGTAIQNLLGAYYAAVLPSPGVCHQVRLRELDGYRVLDARLYRNVLMVIGEQAGRYDKLIFRFAADFGSHDLRTVPDVASTNLNFTVLESGIVLHLTEEDSLEIFTWHHNSARLSVVQDPAIQSDARLFHTGSQALIARDNKLFKIKMRQAANEASKPAVI